MASAEIETEIQETPHQLGVEAEEDCVGESQFTRQDGGGRPTELPWTRLADPGSLYSTPDRELRLPAIRGYPS